MARESQRAEARRTGESLYAVRRRRGAELGFSARQSAGHAGPGETPISRTPVATFPIYSGGRIVEVDVTRSEASRAARYLALVRALNEGRISPTEFERKVGRMKAIAGAQPEANPRTALALGVGTPPEGRRACSKGRLASEVVR